MASFFLLSRSELRQPGAISILVSMKSKRMSKMAKNDDQMVPCSVFGGRSRKTGVPVGSRHRWIGDQCDYCGRRRNDVMSADGTFAGIAVRRRRLGLCA